MNILKRSPVVRAVLAIFASVAPIAVAPGGIVQNGAFNYQGVLRQNGQPFNGTCDFEFRLYDSSGGATQIGPMVPVNNQTIVDGQSNTILNFEEPPPAPPVWDGNERWLE